MASHRQTLTIPTAVRAWVACCLVVGWFLVGHPASAGPPLLTDDPETPGRGGWEINISANVETTNDEFLMALPLVDLNYGLLENDQWKLEFPVLFVDPTDDQGHWGVGDLLFGYKYRFLEEDENGFMASIYPELLIPTATVHAQLSGERLILGAGRTELLLPAQIGKHFFDERLLVYAEAGYNVVFDGSGENNWIYGVAAEWQRTERLKLLFEVGGLAFERDNEPDFAFFNGGFKLQLTEHCTLLGSAGRSFRNRASGAPQLLIFFGLQITTDGAHRR